MIDIIPHELGCVIGVRAHAGGRKNEVRPAAAVLKVSVTAAPEKGKANKAIITLLADSLGLKRSQIELLAGETSPQKRFLIRDITPAELTERLAHPQDFFGQAGIILRAV